MAKLSYAEKMKLERFLEMGSGYVLDFSNRTLEEFVFDSVDINIYDDRYDYASGSKANRLRGFWEAEHGQLVAKLIIDLVEYGRDKRGDDTKELADECRGIGERLKAEVPVPDLDAIQPNADGRDFETLARTVRESIQKNEPEIGLDRLHTFVVKYMRVICDRHGIGIGTKKPLHGLMGEYAKAMGRQGKFQSEMTERILKSSIANLEAFNHVRNRHSLAHDNKMLSYDEALLIFTHVTAAIRFVSSLEADEA